MSRLLVSCLLTALATAGLQPSALDAPITGGVRFDDPAAQEPCDIGVPLHQIAHQAHLLYGFENRTDCRPSRLASDPVPGHSALAAASARDALDRLTALAPDFRWKQIDGVIVVRPSAAWSDRHDVLTLPVAAFSVPQLPLDDALHRLLESASPPIMQDHEDTRPRGRRIDSAVSVSFGGGPLLSALNTLVAARGDAMWQLGFTGGFGAGHRARAVVSIATIELSGGNVLAPILLPETGR
jgi:hypothetical protein